MLYNKGMEKYILESQDRARLREVTAQLGGKIELRDGNVVGVVEADEKPEASGIVVLEEK